MYRDHNSIGSTRILKDDRLGGQEETRRHRRHQEKSAEKTELSAWTKSLKRGLAEMCRINLHNVVTNFFRAIIGLLKPSEK